MLHGSKLTLFLVISRHLLKNSAPWRNAKTVVQRSFKKKKKKTVLLEQEKVMTPAGH